MSRKQAPATEESIFDIIPTPMTYFGHNSSQSNKNSAVMSNLTTEADISDEARYNLATRIMSNGVEVIIAGDKSKSMVKSIHSSQSSSSTLMDELQLSRSQIRKPMTLAPSTLSSQMILLVPNNLKINFTIPINTNQFVTKTCFTTYTYRTTYLQDGMTTVESQEKVIANIATEERNYPKINSTLSKGVTLTRTPQLAVGVFPTTYSYFFTLYDGESTKILASDLTVSNTLTAPEDYISFLQPSEAATPVYDTNTYFNHILITKTLDSKGSLKLKTNSETLTQVIVTESLPARSTSVLTSYYAFDVDETLSQAFSTNFAPKSEFPNQSNYDLHIYATKTFLTTFTYLTTNTVLKSSEKQDFDIFSSTLEDPTLSYTTTVNYRTRVIENVIAQAIPTTLLKPEVITRFRNELKRGKNHRGVIVTLATLLGGQTLEITAMKYIHPKTSTSFIDQNSVTLAFSSNDNADSEQILPPKHLQSHEIRFNSSFQDTTPLNIRDTNETTNLDSDYEASNLIPSIVKISSEKAKNNSTKEKFENEITPQAPTYANIFGSLNGLTVLRPVFSAMAGLIQSKFAPNGNVPESKNILKHSKTNTNHEQSHDNPLYIPFQNLKQSNNKNKTREGTLLTEGSNFDVVKLSPPQSLHIQPPDAELTPSDDNWIHGKYTSENQNLVAYKNENGSNQQPLINGGIPIRPGEVITANSDVIVGKPNGIEQPEVYTFQSSVIPLRRGNSKDSSIPFGLPKNWTYHAQNSFKHGFPTSKYSVHATLRPIENYDNILRPPPSPQLSGLSKFYPRPTSIGNLSPDPPVRQSNFQSPISFPRDQGFVKKDAYRYPQKIYLNNNFNKNDVMDIHRAPEDLSTSNVSNYPFSKQENQDQFHLRLSSHAPTSTSNLLFSDFKSNKRKHQESLQFEGYLTPTPLLPNLRQTSNHHRISLQTNVLNHNVAINVPPLTFKKEPDLLTPVLHGIPSISGPLTMPHIKIQPNEDEVQVNLTPNHRFYQQSVSFNTSPTVKNISFSLSNDNEITTPGTWEPNRNWDDITKLHYGSYSEVDPLSILTNLNTVKTPIENMVKEVEPTLVLKPYQTNKFSLVEHLPHLSKEWNKGQINSESIGRTKDQSGASSSVKNQLLLSQQPNDLRQLNLSRQAQRKKPPYPLLNPLTALQVNFLDDTSSKNVHRSELQSKGKLNYNTSISNKPKIILAAKQSVPSLYPKPNSSLLIHTSRNPSKLNGKWASVNVTRFKSPSTVPHYKKTHQTTSVPHLYFTYGQPFTQQLTASTTGSKNHQNRKTNTDVNFLISAGQSFKLNEPHPQLNKNISEKNVMPPYLSSSEVESDHKGFENMNGDVLRVVAENFNVKKSGQSNSNEFGVRTAEETSFNEEKKSPTVNISDNNIYTIPLSKSKVDLDNHYYSKTITSSKSNLTMQQSPIKIYFSHSPEILEMYPTSIHSTTSLPKKSYTTIKNINYKSVQLSSTHAIPTETMQSKSFNQKPAVKSNYSLVSTNSDYKMIPKHSTLLETDVSSMPTKTKATIITTLLFNENHVNFKDSSKESTVLLSKTPILHYQEKHQETNKNDRIVLEPSIDLSNSLLKFSMEHYPSSSIMSKSSVSKHVFNFVESTESTPSLRKIFQHTKFITHTVTTTKTTIATSTIKNERDKIHSNFKMTTFHRTTTFTTTVIDTVTETQTIIQPTKTIDFDSYSFIASIEDNTTTNLNHRSSETRQPDIDKLFSAGNENDYSIGTSDKENIFVVMTNRKGAPNIQTLLDTPNIDSEEDLATRDEEIFLGAEDGINNILLGGVLIATPSHSSVLVTRPPDIELVNTERGNASAIESECQPACKTSRNELCNKFASRHECVCRPGFARMFPDRPCRPTYTYTMRVPIKRLAEHQLLYNDSLSNNSTRYFQELATITRDALERMVMQSDFRDQYQGVFVESYSTDSMNKTLIANTLLQFSDMNEEKRLEDGFKKYLRVNGYNIGLTNLFTDKNGADMITVLDFDECFHPKFHDCAVNAHCFNLKGTYTCSCKDGYIDLSENSLFPGRLCSSEIIGCEKCNFHGQCVSLAKAKLKDDSIVCDCFAWYSGSVCQLNLKILLIALMAVGTILFVVLLLCILLTCMKHRKPKQPFLEALFAEVKDGRQKPKGLIDMRVNAKDRHKTINFQKIVKADKRAMILDTSSESSDCSLPYVLKGSLRSDQKLHKKLAVHKETGKNDCVLAINEPFKEFSMKNHSLGVQPMLPTFSHCPSNTFFTEIEQSDRSLTVMIPRAKYHPSVLPQAKLLQHQLTLERTNAKSLKQLNEQSTKQTKPGLEGKQNTLRANNIPGASLVSAGFEVSATVNANSLCSSHESPKIIAITHDCMVGNNFCDLIATRCQYNEQRGDELNINDTQKSVNSKDTMEEWLQNVQEIPSSTDGQSFGDPMFRLVKCEKKEHDNQTVHTNEEANTMAERDVSTFLLPHTHLYKPERESDISGLDSL